MTELLYRVALTQIPAIGPVQAKLLTEAFGSARAVFEARGKDLAHIEGIGDIRAASIKSFRDFDSAEKEILFADKHSIRVLFLTDKEYPQRLLNCYDPPTLLFYRGNADLNATHIISIIGTRNCTEYGRHVTESLVAGLVSQQVLVVSGLAFGIDAIAHKSALKNGLATIGVLAHGHGSSIYPYQHKQLSSDMLDQGGLLTEMPGDSKADKHNFPRRNRIVAGMADVTVVVETATKGGSMITAELAHNYNRDLFAVPGKVSDNNSSGCLKLIQQNKAVLYTDPGHLIDTMGWLETKKMKRASIELFPDLTNDEKMIVDFLKTKETVHIDELHVLSGMSSSAIASAILNLELQNIVRALPGKMFRLL